MHYGRSSRSDRPRLDCGGSQLTALCVFALPREPVVARAAAIQWPLRGRGHALPPSLRAAATLVHEGEDEVPVAIELRSRRLALKQRHRVVEVLESVVPELFGRAVSRSTRGTSPAVPDSGDQ